jgi:LPXTG-motif cell wall-anchored protein
MAMKRVYWVIVVMTVFALLIPMDAFSLGWFPDPPGGGGGGGGPVSAPEPGAMTLIGIAVGAGVGYYFGKRKNKRTGRKD